MKIKIKNISKFFLCILLVLSMVLSVSAMYQENYIPKVPADDYGLDFIVYDKTMEANEDGSYSGTMTARLTGKMSTATGVSGGFVSWFWSNELPEPALENTPPLGYAFPVETDVTTGLSSKRASFHFNQAADEGDFTAGENGTGYKEFQLKFSNVNAVPGQAFSVKVEDYYNNTLGESTLLLAPADLTMEDPPVIRGDVVEGQLRAPGRTIIYKSDAAGTQTYEQIYNTDEELVGKTLLTPEETGITAEPGKEFLGWSIKPDLVNEVQYRPGDALDKKNNDGRYKIQNLVLYPVYQGEEHLEGNWVDYVVYDTKAEVNPTLAKGRYDATLNVRIIADLNIISELTMAALEWSWPTRLPDPTLENMPDADKDNVPSYVIPEDESLGLISHRRIYMWDKRADHGALTPADDGTGYGYHEFQIRFENFAGDPGETIDNIRLRDYFSNNQQMSTMNGTSAVTGEEVITLRCHVKTGSITVPGKKMLYKADDSGNAKTYEQIYYSDEEVLNANVLNNDPTQNPNQPLTMPNFEAPAGKTFAGWSTSVNASEATYQPGDPLKDLENMTLYPVWTAKDSYTITYDGNGGTPERAYDDVLKGDSLESLPSATHPEKYIFSGWYTEDKGGEQVNAPFTPSRDATLYAHWETTYKVSYLAGNGTGEMTDEKSPYKKDDYVVVKAPEGLTSPGEAWVFAGWQSNVPVIVGTSKRDVLNPDDTFRMPEQDVILTAIWDNTISDICPLELNLTEGTLKNKKGEDVKTGFVSTGRTIAVTEDAFLGCNAKHMHELIVKGSTTKDVTVESAGEEIGVYVNGVSAKSLFLDFTGRVIFGSNGAATGNTFNHTDGEGLTFGQGIHEIKINDGVMVTSVSNGNSPVVGTEGKAKVLDLIMHEGSQEDRELVVNERSVLLPANYQRIAILDNIEGTWLNGSVKVTDVNGTEYVRGVAEDINDTEYLDSRFNDDNLYGNTFALSEESGGNTSAYGLYDKVRLPKAVKQVKASLPTRMLFNIYTKGSENVDFGFIGPVSKMKNESYSADDSLTIGSVTKEYGRANSKLDIGFLGTMEQPGEPSGYTLADYSKVTQEEMEQTVEKPKVCLEAVANGDANNGIPIPQTDALLITPVDWFVADSGESSFQLVVPKAFQEKPSGKRFYQMPSLLGGGTGEQKVSGHHYLRLAFSVSDVQN